MRAALGSFIHWLFLALFLIGIVATVLYPDQSPSWSPVIVWAALLYFLGRVVATFIATLYEDDSRRRRWLPFRTPVEYLTIIALLVYLGLDARLGPTVLIPYGV